MDKLMPLDYLASIKGAESSKAVTELFNVIKRSEYLSKTDTCTDKDIIHTASLDELRNDEIIRCPEREVELIRKNFPKEKKGYLVVPKVIEDQ